MRDVMEQRVMKVTAVEELVAPGPPPDGIGQWRMTCTDEHTSERMVLEVCNPPEEGSHVFVEVVGVCSAAPVGGEF